MPSIAAHMVCAKLVANKLNITDTEFIKGNLLPDIIDEQNSHHKIVGKHYYIPDINYFLEILDLNNNLYLGYLVHLLLDKYFLEDYIYEEVKGDEVFLSGIMYKEYDIINYELIEKFEIDIDYLNNILIDFSVPINETKYQKNIQCLNTNDSLENLTYLSLDSFAKFLNDTSIRIVNYIEEVKKDECKFGLSHNCSRQRTKS